MAPRPLKRRLPLVLSHPKVRRRFCRLLDDAAQSKVSLKLDYIHSKLFMEMHSDIFGGGERWSGPMPVPVWRRVRAAVEYHASTERMYHYIIPRLRALRAKYRAVKGRLVTFTTIVDPITVIKSFYQMWPPRGDNRTLVPFRNWLRSAPAAGIITRSLSNGARGCNSQRAISTLYTLRSDRVFTQARQSDHILQFF